MITLYVTIFFQSSMGASITAEQVASKIPADADAAYVRIDKNAIWWVRGKETGMVDIWE